MNRDEQGLLVVQRERLASILATMRNTLEELTSSSALDDHEDLLVSNRSMIELMEKRVSFGDADANAGDSAMPKFDVGSVSRPLFQAFAAARKACRGRLQLTKRLLRPHSTSLSASEPRPASTNCGSVWLD